MGYLFGLRTRQRRRPLTTSGNIRARWGTERDSRRATRDPLQPERLTAQTPYTKSPIASAPTTTAKTNTAIGQRGRVDTA